MQETLHQRDLRPRTILELLDGAFWIYRSHVSAYFRALSLLFFFLGLPMFVFLYKQMVQYPETSFNVLLLGNSLPDGWLVSFPVRVFLRDICFADGAIPWTIAATLLVPTTANIHRTQYMDQCDTPSTYSRKIWILVLLAGLPIIALRLIGVGLLADIMRLPILFVPHVLVLEQASIYTAIRRSWNLVLHDLPRALMMFVLVLGGLRLAMALPVVSFIFLAHLVPGNSLANLQRLDWLIPLFVLAVEVLIYPVAQIAVTLFYYDLRIRSEGMDMTLALPDSARGCNDPG